MLTQKQLKLVNELKQKKFRAEHNLFIAEGVKVVTEVLQSAIKVKQLFATADFISNTAIPKYIECIEVKPSELERLTALTTPNEVLAVCETPNYQFVPTELKSKLTLVLDDIRDPGNLGTIIRIADWFGIENIICSNETADVFNPKVVQATMGSITRIKVHYVGLIPFFENLKNNQTLADIPVYGALLDGSNLYKESLSAEGLIVIGNESKGISADVVKCISHKISIPSYSHYKTNGGEAESLNAAIATSIICAEFRRKVN